MVQHCVRARHKRKYIATTNSKHGLPVAPNLLERNFTAPAPNRVWTSDITYVATADGWLYLAVIIDLFSRQVVGLVDAAAYEGRVGHGCVAHGMVPASPRCQRDCV
ncbi:conserved hypothetical protein [Cupriavidus taiwanensis]|nr:conserved hypothetical protein [Cupriavidus taiwanensis]